MKTLLIPCIFLLGSALFSNELSWVDEQVQAIKPERTGMNSKSLNLIKDPFIFIKTKVVDKKKILSSSPGVKSLQPKAQKKILTLSAIVNGSAMINQQWYKKGDKIDGYTIKEIDLKTVLLSKNKKQLLLSTRSVSKNLKFNNK